MNGTINNKELVTIMDPISYDFYHLNIPDFTEAEFQDKINEVDENGNDTIDFPTEFRTIITKHKLLLKLSLSGTTFRI